VIAPHNDPEAEIIKLLLLRANAILGKFIAEIGNPADDHRSARRAARVSLPAQRTRGRRRAAFFIRQAETRQGLHTAPSASAAVLMSA
jgi:hypothetical protein